MVINIRNTYTDIYKKVTSLTRNVVVPAGSDRAIYCFIAGSTKSAGDAKFVSGITFNGAENFVKVGTGELQNGKATSSIWRLLNPSVTTADIVISFDDNNSNWNGGGSVIHILDNVHQTTPDSGWTVNTGSSTSSSVISITSSSTDLVHGIMGAGAGTQLLPPSDTGEQTTTDLADITNTKMAIGCGHATGDGTTMNFSWSISTTTTWVHAITNIKQAAATTNFGGKVQGVANASISKVQGVVIANIAKVSGS